MNGKTASLFFILGIAFLLMAIFGEPVLDSIRKKLDSIEEVNGGNYFKYEDQYDDETDLEESTPPIEAIPPPPPPPPPPRKEVANQVFDFAEVMPQYPGGDYALKAEVQKAFDIPREYINSGEKGGHIVVRFVVERDGSVGQVQVLKDLPNCDACSKEAVKAMRSLKYQFEPGKQDGKPVAVHYTLPIVIKIR